MIRHRPGPTALNPQCFEARGAPGCPGCGEQIAPTRKHVVMGFPCCGYVPQGVEAVRLIEAARLREA